MLNMTVFVSPFVCKTLYSSVRNKITFCERESSPPYEKTGKTKWWVILSLTERTDITELFHPRFEPTDGLRPTENTEPFS